AVYKASAVGAVFGLGLSPDPGPGASVELGGAGRPATGPPPAHLLDQQDPPDLAAAHGDTGVPGRAGEGVQRPLRRAALIVSGQLPGGVRGRPPGGFGAGKRDDPGPLTPVRRGMPGAREPADQGARHGRPVSSGSALCGWIWGEVTSVPPNWGRLSPWCR